jgi:hypothetical protein
MDDPSSCVLQRVGVVLHRRGGGVDRGAVLGTGTGGFQPGDQPELGRHRCSAPGDNSSEQAPIAACGDHTFEESDPVLGEVFELTWS